MKVEELIGEELDAAVAKCVGAFFDEPDLSPVPYSTDWSLGGPIIEREQIIVMVDGDGWLAFIDPDFDMRNGGTFKPLSLGPTLLIAAMRALVASRQQG